jgi:hypothetical protein
MKRKVMCTPELDELHRGLNLAAEVLRSVVEGKTVKVEAKQVWTEAGMSSGIHVIGQDIKGVNWVVQYNDTGAVQVWTPEAFDRLTLVTNADGTPAEPEEPKYQLVPMTVDKFGVVMAEEYRVWPPYENRVWPHGMTLLGYTDDPNWLPGCAVIGMYWKRTDDGEMVIRRFAVFAKLEMPE